MVIEEEYEKEQVDVEIKKELCPYAAVGECRYGENCVYIHGDVCDMCGLQVLHPIDAAQRSEHIKVSKQLPGVKTALSYCFLAPHNHLSLVSFHLKVHAGQAVNEIPVVNWTVSCQGHI